MIFYNENNEIVKYNSNKRLGSGLYGSVYRINFEECVKKFKKENVEIDKEVLLLIQKIGLDNFCQIRSLLYNKNKKLIGYLMRYYQKENIDILTMPTEYIIENLRKLYISVIKLTHNNIYIDDMHTENIIINSKGITVIDYDLYTLNRFLTPELLEYKNTSALRVLFETLFIETLIEFHRDLCIESNNRLIKRTFHLWNSEELDKTCKKLTRYKYPIDYIIQGNL